MENYSLNRSQLLSLIYLWICFVTDISSACDGSEQPNHTGCWYTVWYAWLCFGVILLLAVFVCFLNFRNPDRRTRARGRPAAVLQSYRRRTTSSDFWGRSSPEFIESSHLPPTYDNLFGTTSPPRYMDVFVIGSAEDSSSSSASPEHSMMSRQANQTLASLAMASIPPQAPASPSPSVKSLPPPYSVCPH